MATATVMLGASVLATIGVAGPAQAAPRTQNIGMNCWSLNPNIVDVPFFAGVTVRTDTGRPGDFSIWADSKSLFPYTTDTTVTVTELSTGRAQSHQRHWQHGLGDLPGYWIDGLHGSGPIRVTIRSVGHGLIPSLPAPVCSGTATV
ncbi:hypothetical protein [Gordonia sp. DT101]|uniref:hypothetical protein n=1 Tax=Gordonia sp. DT101 TaxID=3416545 RepID=UPI003CEC9167